MKPGDRIPACEQERKPAGKLSGARVRASVRAWKCLRGLRRPTESPAHLGGWPCVFLSRCRNEQRDTQAPLCFYLWSM